MRRSAITLTLLLVCAFTGISRAQDEEEAEPTASSTPVPWTPEDELARETRLLESLEAQLQKLSQEYWEQGTQETEEQLPRAALVLAEAGPSMNSCDLVIRAADLLYRAGQCRTALEHYTWAGTLAKSKEDRSWVAFQIGNCFYRLGQYDQAVQAHEATASQYVGTIWSDEAACSAEMARWQATWEARGASRNMPTQEETP